LEDFAETLAFGFCRRRKLAMDYLPGVAPLSAPAEFAKSTSPVTFIPGFLFSSLSASLADD